MCPICVQNCSISSQVMCTKNVYTCHVIHTPPRPVLGITPPANAQLHYASVATPASRAAVAYEVARIYTTGGNDPCPPTWPRPYLSPCEASPGRQTRLTAMRGTIVFHLASHKTPRLTSGPVLSASISNSLSFKHPAPASRPQY